MSLMYVYLEREPSNMIKRDILHVICLACLSWKRDMQHDNVSDTRLSFERETYAANRIWRVIQSQSPISISLVSFQWNVCQRDLGCVCLSPVPAYVSIPLICRVSLASSSHMSQFLSYVVCLSPVPLICCVSLANSSHMSSFLSYVSQDIWEELAREDIWDDDVSGDKETSEICPPSSHMSLCLSHWSLSGGM